MNCGNLIGNINLVQIINIFNNKLKGYECVYKDFAIYNDNKIIDKKLDLSNHSPIGLCWGYNGSASSQAALAILWDFTKDDEFSLNYYIDFRNEIISKLPQKDYIMKFSIIQHWVDLKRQIIKWVTYENKEYLDAKIFKKYLIGEDIFWISLKFILADIENFNSLYFNTFTKLYNLILFSLRINYFDK